MLARDVMTRNVVTVAPDATSRDIAKLLMEHRISAVPVVEGSGAPIGMVSEGDLLGRDEAERRQRRDWWLTLLAEGEALNPDFLASMARQERRARDIMATPVQSVTEDADVAEIARLLTEHRFKRVPVLRDGKMVGIVSRADLVRAIADRATETPASHWRNPFARLDEHFLHRHRTAPAENKAQKPESPPVSEATADSFRGLVHHFGQEETEHRRQAEHAAEERRHEAVEALEEQHLSNAEWQALLQQARDAAGRGAKEFMLLRFPSDVCSDGGRAINAPLPDWPQTLRGKPAELYRRWDLELHPHGFHIAARVLDFPRGFPGDIGLFLIWGE